MEPTLSVSTAGSEDNEAEGLRKNLNFYFQDINASYDDWEMPYPQKFQEEIIAAGLEENWEVEYPQLAKLSQQVYSSSAVSNYRPPTDSTMGPANYPPAINIESTIQKPTFEGYTRQAKFKKKGFF